MRIAGAIIAMFLALIILVQSLAAGTVDAIEDKGGTGGSWGFLVAVLFVVGAALMFGKVMKGAVGTWLAAGLFAWIGAASSVFGDLWVWGFVGFVYALGCYRGRRPDSATPSDSAPSPTPST